MLRHILAAAACAATFSITALSAQTVPLGANLERFDYPAPVRWFETSSQGRAVRMAFLDWPATAKPTGTTIVLLHGKNFCAAT